MTKRIALIHILVAVVCGAPAARAQTIDAILDSLQYGAFRYAWYQANPANGLIRDRSQSGSPCSIAAVGFGLSAICIGVDHGWVTRATAAARVRTTLETFWNGEQSTSATTAIGYQGFFYHFLDMNTALRMASWDTELSTIDTALLLAGILDAKAYFTGPAADEVQIRMLADAINQRVNWPFMQNTSGINAWSLRHGWKPATGFLMCGATTCDWIGYDEAMILYILALGSDSHPLANPALAWGEWTSGYSWQTWSTYSYVNFPPLFGHQYSHCWIDFSHTHDAYMRGQGIDYFENSRRATLAQRAYAIANPPAGSGIGANLWGFTASDGPSGYAAHGAPPPQSYDGTVTPTAAISSIPFAPAEVIPVIQNLWTNYKSLFWGPYGFRDAMNLVQNPDWYDADVLGIDQGPIAIMIENYLNGRVWTRFMKLPEINLGMRRAGFVFPVSVPVGGDGGGAGLELAPATPNPFNDHTVLRYRLAATGPARLTVHDVTGRVVARLVDGEQGAGLHEVRLAAGDLPSGVYRCRLEAGGRSVECVVVRLR